MSYSWTSPAHEQWVLDLATELVESGVDVELDKWSLREGQDKYHYMESMVKDPTITKVIVVADAEYARKADLRQGGVGTESQVISKEVYERVDQQKFVAVLKELSGDGQPCLPTFFQSRMYIDMSDDAKRHANFERLVRWLFDKPQHQKPMLGEPPEYIKTDLLSLGTASRARHAVGAVRSGSSSAIGALRDYLDTFAEALMTTDVGAVSHRVPGDGMIEALPGLLPARDEFVEVAFVTARYLEHDAAYASFGDFFEAMLADRAFCGSPTGEDERTATLRFFVYELVLYFVAAALKHDRLPSVRSLFERMFILPPSANRPGGLREYLVLQQRPQSLMEKARLTGEKGIYLVADLLRQRATNKDIRFLDIVQADFVAFAFSRLRGLEPWRPHAALLMPRYEALPLFRRAQSMRHFAALSLLFDVADPNELRQRMRQNVDAQWTQYWDALDIQVLMDEEVLGSRP